MLKAAIVVGILLVAAPLAAAAPLPDPRTASTDCSASGGKAAIRKDSVHAGPFYLPGPGGRSSHFSKASGRFTSKLPSGVVGHREVVVRVPARLRERVRIMYGGSGLATEISFAPCVDSSSTFFPGGIVFKRLEPISLLVEVAGEGSPRRLRLGVIRPR